MRKSAALRTIRTLSIAVFLLAGISLFVLLYQQASYFHKQERLRSGLFASNDRASHVQASLAKIFEIVAVSTKSPDFWNKAGFVIPVPGAAMELKKSASPSWDQLVGNEVIVIPARETSATTEVVKQWNLSRPLQPADGLLVWQDAASQRVFFASATSMGLVVFCLMPPEVLQLVLGETSGQEKSEADFQLALVSYPDGRLLSNQVRESKDPDLLVSTDSVLLNLPFLQRARVGGNAIGIPGARVVDSGGTEILTASSLVMNSNLGIFAVTQMELAPIFRSALNLSSFALTAVLLLFALLYAWAQRMDVRERMGKAETQWKMQLSDLQDQLAAVFGAILRMSDWQIAATGGNGVVLSKPGSLADFGLPGTALSIGQSEINPSWRERMVVARLAQSDCFAIAIVDAATPIREALSVYFETLIGEVPQGSQDQFEAWIAEKHVLFDTVFSNFSATDLESIRAVGVFFWSPVTGIIDRFGQLGISFIENEYWQYALLVDKQGGPEIEFDVRSPLILWRTLRAERLPDAVDPIAEEAESSTSEESGSSETASEGSADDAAEEETASDETTPDEADSDESKASGPVSACHWLVVAALLAFAWLLGDAFGVFPSQIGFEAAVAGANASSNADENAKDVVTKHEIGFDVETIVGVGRYRLPGHADFLRVTDKSVLPMGSEIVLSMQIDPVEYVRSVVDKSHSGKLKEPEIILNHRVHGKVVLSGEGVMLLSEDFFSRNLGGLRFSESEEIPSRIELKISSSKSPLERVFAFFLPRNDIPVEFPNSARSEMQQRFPIIVRYPDRVFLLKTNTLPAVVSLAWQSAPEHRKPYRVYLWSADKSSNAPIQETMSTIATIQISNHGRYYWQVEDRLGNFISAPRTLLVNALDADVAGPGESDQLRPGRKDIFRQIRNIPVEFPVADALVYGCPEKGDTSLPLRFHHAGSDISRYEVTVNPGSRAPKTLAAPVEDGPVISEIELPKEGSYSVKVLGYDKSAKLIATSEQLRGVFYTACGLGAKPEFLTQVFKVTKGKTLPDLGMLHVMVGAY